MLDKLQYILQLASQAAHKVTSGPDEWASFLKTAARLYKYPFQDQLLIYAQRPDATACATYDVWNNRMNRWVKRGSAGIALIAETPKGFRLKYVFDVADTGGSKNSRDLQLWNLRADYLDTVAAEVKSEYGVSENSLPDCLMDAASTAVVDGYPDLLPDLIKFSPDSFLDGLDKDNVAARLRSTLTASVQYIVLTRCGIDPEQFVTLDDLRGIVDFNTITTLSCLGDATANFSGGILRQVEQTVKKLEKQNTLENRQNQEYNEFNALKQNSVREAIDHHGNDIHEERGYLIPDLKMDPQPEGKLGKYGLMREDYLKKHHEGMYTALLLSGKLWAHLLEIDQTAQKRESKMIRELAVQRGVNEAMKASNQMRWVQEMNNIRATAEETIQSELIYS